MAKTCKDTLGCDVEIEFAMTLDRRSGLPARLGFLQVRPMMVADEQIEVKETDLHDERALLASDLVLGNGESTSIVDLVYVKPVAFDPKYTRVIAAEIEKFNTTRLQEQRDYALIGFGRWGSSDPWRHSGNLAQISGA
ncbi:MAG: hypothetical protein R3E58_01185 [Phycisphaerae bacterium]